MIDPRRNFALKLLGEMPDPDFRRTRPEDNLDLHPGLLTEARLSPTIRPNRAGWLEPKTRVVPSACFSCNTNCEVLVLVDEASGRILKVEGDPGSPVTKGVLCAKGLAAKDLLDNPGRLRAPLKRVGERGQGQWEQISWDEALSLVAEKLTYYKEKFGPQGLAFLEGTRRGWSRIFSRLAYAFGAMNHGAAGWAQCLWPRLVDNAATFGASYMEAAEYENSNCVLVWGVNPPATWPIKAADIMDARERGAALIVVDPHFSETAAKADLWLQLRPETDVALALAMMHVIINQGLYDSLFVEKWTTGFDRLKEHVATCTPEWGEKITRVPAGLIMKAAKIYATARPACISRCVALDVPHDSLQACRAVSLLAAITGNIGLPGGNVLVSSRGEISQNTHDFIGNHLISEELLHLRRGYERFPFLCSKLSPVPSAHMPSLWETMATGRPYPIKAALVFGSNAVVSYSNTKRVREALAQLEFLVVADLFLTPTGQLADLILPASSWLERDNVISSFQSSYTHTIAQQKAAVLADARSDVDIINELARRLGLGEKFWKDEESLYDYLLGPTGFTFAQFKTQKRLFAPLEFHQHEKRGFKTPSGKIELYSSILEKHGSAPLPVYIEPFQSPLSTPELTQEFPLIMTSGRRPCFRHTENRQNPLLRELCQESRVRIHPDTAARAGIKEGDEVMIESSIGWAKSVAELTEGVPPDVIQTMPGWGGEENVNNLIPWGQFAEGMGTVSMHSIMCRVRKTDG